MLIKRNDNVKILTGKDRGKTGKVVQVFPVLEKVVVEGANLATKHLRRRRESEQGQKLSYSAPIHASNVQVICPKCSKPSRMGRKVLKDAKGTTRVRVCKECKEVIE